MVIVYMELFLKEILQIVKFKCTMQMMIGILDWLKMNKEMVKGLIYILRVIFMKDNGKKEWNMEKVN